MPCPDVPYRNHHHGVPVRVGATWCVAHRIGLPIGLGRRGALPIAMRRPSRRGDAVRRPLRASPSRRGDAVRRPKWLGHGMPCPYVPHRNHHHGVPVRVGTTRLTNTFKLLLDWCKMREAYSV
ncbi:MAG: hypothetical protein KatS3mg040_1851 [Candidatus Kapaibacterium sp.]|nr:MAG: hypothetical protein KatS3mg040_1851 [Candidatus Kapabacteria bacterium]